MPLPALDDRLAALAPVEGGPRPGEGLLVALSGGLDSTVLLHLLARLAPHRGLRLVVAHLDHGLRDGTAELAHCQRHCGALGLPLIQHRVDGPALVAASQRGPEGALREARHEWLQRLRVEQGLDAVATAHHRDDHHETQWMRLLRGSGPGALARGIVARDDGAGWLRPLRPFDRAELEAWARREGLDWCEDPTNRDHAPLRNWLRHELLPGLRGRFGAAAGARLEELGARVGQDSAALDAIAARALAGALVERPGGGFALPREAFDPWPEAVRARIMLQLAPRLDRPREHQRWNAAALSRVLQFASDGRAGQGIDLPGGGRLELGAGELFLLPSGLARGAEPPLPTLERELLPAPGPGVNFGGDLPWVAHVDADRVGAGLQLRRAKAGDRLGWPGLGGRKRLADLQREHGIPRTERGQALVVEDGAGIVWAVGLATAAHARISSRTNRVLRLSLSPAPTESPMPPPGGPASP